MDIQKNVATILHYKLKVQKKLKTQIAVIATQAAWATITLFFTYTLGISNASKYKVNIIALLFNMLILNLSNISANVLNIFNSSN